MQESLWGKKGATLSHKNACKEFGLSEDDIYEAMRAGKLQYRQNYAHGNPYFRLLRNEVEALAQELRGQNGLEEQKIRHELAVISKEINSLRRKLASLEKRKAKLMQAM